MYYNFAVAIDFDNQMDYDEKFGQHIGEHFASAMEECFYRNPIHDADNVYFGAPLDTIMSLPQFLTAVLAMYITANGKHPKAALSSLFKGSFNVNRHFPVNDVRKETTDGKRCFVYRNIEGNVEQAILFGAYFLASIKAEIWDDEKEVREFLLQSLKEEALLSEEDFEQKHVSSFLYKMYFRKTMKQIVTSIYNDRQEESNPSKGLDYYRDHPVYGLGYDSVISCLGAVSMNAGIEFEDGVYLNVFKEAESCVERILNSKNPEIEISRVHAYLAKEYQVREHNGSNYTYLSVSPEFHIGCIIELLFLIAVYEMLPEMSEHTRQTLINCRVFLEKLKYINACNKDAMWELVAQRIPPLPGRPRVEDLQVEIKRLNEELGNYTAGNCSSLWYDLVQRIVKPFDDVMSPVGFYEIPMVKRLSRIGQCELIAKLFMSTMPFKVALLSHIRFMECIEQNEAYTSQAARLRLIEQALNIKADNRELKGNFNALKDGSKEDFAKYTAYNFKRPAEEFYDSLEATPN